MTAIPTKKSNTIFCTPFDSDIKKDIINRVLTKYPELMENYSSEGGFELPLTGEWRFCYNLRNYDIMCKYHGSRQLRFVTDYDNKNIIGIRMKDNINYFSDIELNKIIQCINEAVVEYNGY
jgi:hypothetical protein